jgi:parvulin-like peptidyl-prolyl isomerase
MAVGAAVIAIVLAIVGFGYYATTVAPARELLSTVGGTPIRAADYLTVVRVLALSESPQSGPEVPLGMLEDYELMRQGGKELDEPIEVTDDEVTELIKSTFFPEDQEVSEEDLNELYRRLSSDYGVSKEDLRWFFEFQLLQGKLDEYLRGQVPEVGVLVPQAHVQAILVASEEVAQEVIQRLDGGEDFAAIAEEYEQGDGDLGWLPRGIVSPEFDTVAFDPALELHTVSDPFQDSDGYWVIKVLEREERALDEARRGQLEANAFDYWLEAERDEKVDRKVDDEGLVRVYQWAMGQID